MRFSMKLSRCSKGKNRAAFGSSEVTYRIEQRDIKYPRIEINPDAELLILLPQGMSSAQEILKNKEDWIYKKISEIDEAMEKISVDKKDFKENFIFLGDAYDIKHERGRYSIEKNEGFLKISSPKNKTGLAHLKNWTKDQLRDKITDFSDFASNLLDVEYDKIYIREQTTKWASCSSKDNLSFNLRCAALPEELLRYLVLHELVHLKERKHDKAFWRTIGELQSDYEEKEESLIGWWFLVHQNNFWNKLVDELN